MASQTSMSPIVAELITRSRSNPALTREQEYELHKRWKDSGDLGAREQLASANLRYVISTALGFRHYPVDLEDLIAEGNMGLLVAIDKFDPGRGFRLVTYASHWIRAYVITYIMKSWVKGKTRMSTVRSRTFFKLRRDRARVGALFGSDDQTGQLARESNLTQEKLAEVLGQLDTPDFPLEASADASEWTSFRDRIVSAGPSPEDSSSDREQQGIIQGIIGKALGSLDRREKFIVERRMMDDDPQSLAELGRVMGISRERTRQLEMRAIRKLVRSLAEEGVTGKRAHDILSRDLQ